MSRPLPPGVRPLGTTRIIAGGQRSVRRLAALKFDPIGELVAKYRKLEGELERQEQIRDNRIQEMTSSGKIRAYRAEVHHAIYDRLLSISKELLRYGYGRVPELSPIDNEVRPSFVVNLTNDNNQYVVSTPQVMYEAALEEPDDMNFTDNSENTNACYDTDGKPIND